MKKYSNEEKQVIIFKEVINGLYIGDKNMREFASRIRPKMTDNFFSEISYMSSSNKRYERIKVSKEDFRCSQILFSIITENKDKNGNLVPAILKACAWFEKNSLNCKENIGFDIKRVKNAEEQDISLFACTKSVIEEAINELFGEHQRNVSF